jgi:hypothetical protein
VNDERDDGAFEDTMATDHKAHGRLYSVPELKARGWTDTAIKRFLPGEPDGTRDNPRYPNAGAAMKLWMRSRVHRVERTKGFLAWREGVARRKQATQKAVATRVDNMVRQMEEAEITIVRGRVRDEIYRLALSTHGGNYHGEPGPFVWSNRTARNCIRHNLTNYESLWRLCNRGTTGELAYDILRDRVDELIDEAYSEYASDEPE